MVPQDKIHLYGMTFSGSHGVMPHERETVQRFIVDVTLHLDLGKACESDDVSDTVDYAGVYEVIDKIVTLCKFNLIEKLASEIVKGILIKFPLVDKVDITVKKPFAPVIGIFEYMAVSLTRER